MMKRQLLKEIEATDVQKPATRKVGSFHAEEGPMNHREAANAVTARVFGVSPLLQNETPPRSRCRLTLGL